jgi:hypothetical protein
MTLPTDVKELIPEFYSDHSFLVNSENLDFGLRTSGVHATQALQCQSSISYLPLR